MYYLYMFVKVHIIAAEVVLLQLQYMVFRVKFLKYMEVGVLKNINMVT
jgi:hypothetical protein